MHAAFAAELERRGLKEHSNAHFAMKAGMDVKCSVSDCQNLSRYFVGTVGYCGKHHGRALLLRRRAAAIIEKRDNAYDARERAWRREKKEDPSRRTGIRR